MVHREDDRDTVGRLIEEQRQYYDLRAPDYADESSPDRRRSGEMPSHLASVLVDEFAPTGEVLELACGPGAFTRELVRHAGAVTALDGSTRMLERNRWEVGASTVRHVHADIFDWRPDRRFDSVFFGFWLSHVPAERFDEFWSMVRSCLKPGGRVGFVDEDDRGADNDDVVVVDGVPVAPRRLRDGRSLNVIKLYWNPAELEERLRALGWQVTVRSVGDTFLFGSAGPQALPG